MSPASWLHPLIAFVASPLLLGIIRKTKALLAGRSGPPLLQAYIDIAKLLRKGAVYSQTTTWVFRAGPIVSLSATALALCFVPMGDVAGALQFDGDFILVAYLLGLARFFTIAAALDTGSAFEGMGASREAQISALAEPALLLGLVVLAVQTGELSLSGIFAELPASGSPSILLVVAALFVVFLAENARIPVDDPNTHLELTMIHEVMVLDHSGPDLGLIELGAALKLWLLGALVVSVLLPALGGASLLGLGVGVGALFGLALLVGVVDSSMARLSLDKVPQLLVAAGVLAGVALFLVKL